jgi:hypothetical protein
MHSFLDESGNFLPPRQPGPKVSCVGGIAVTAVVRPALMRDWKRLRRQLRPDGSEPKGSSLSEDEISATLQLLARHRVVACVTAIDVGSHSDPAVTLFKKQQAQRLRQSVGPSHHPTMVREVTELADRVEALPNQLFLQAFLTITHIRDCLETITLYYCQRAPRELGHFRWTVDAKNREITAYERTWSTLMLPLLQSLFHREPMVMLEGCDYSAFRRFDMDIPDHIPEPETSGRRQKGTDIGKVMNNIEFKPSDERSGLQLADIVAATASRALNRRLAPRAWRELGPLMVRRTGGSLRMKALDVSAPPPGRSSPMLPYHAYVVEELNQRGRSMLRN